MPTQLMTRGPVQVREFVPDAASNERYNERAEIISRVKVLEKGPDVLVEAYQRELRLGHLMIPREAELEVVRRLFGEVVERRVDRAAFQVVLQGFEDAVLSKDPARVIAAWRRAFEVYDTMAADLASLSGLPEQGRGAA